MSLVTWDWQLAPADGQLLTNDECYSLLDTDFSDDLLKSFPNTPKPDSSPSSEYCISEDGSASLYPSSPPETKPSRAQLATDLLQQLDHQCKQENILSSWLEEKVEIPMFDGLTSIPEGFHPSAPSAAPYAPPHTDELLREFETVYGAVELTHLTPPQSPPATLAPGPASQLLVSYAQNAAAPAPDVWPGVEELLSSPPLTSPQSSAPSSPRSSDDEWSARPKPYSRGTDDRRTRKKEQNKNAATRYRQKKKAEIEVLLGEEQTLRAKHNELGSKRADLQREIRYLKGLMRELFKAKGLIK